MGRYSVKRYKTKRRTKDLDVIFQELSSKDKIQQLLNQPMDETKPGLGQFYCIHCATYMETSIALKTHLKGKVHKRRVKELKAIPYTQEVADAASGFNLTKFLNRVEQIKTQTLPEKSQNEQLLSKHLEDTLAHAKTTEPTLPWAAHGGEQQQQQQQQQQTAEVKHDDEVFMG